MNLEWEGVVPGQWGFAASCTLVRNDPGNVVVLLAAHQLEWNLNPLANKVTFEPVPDFGWILSGESLGSVKTYDVVAYADE